MLTIEEKRALLEKYAPSANALKEQVIKSKIPEERAIILDLFELRIQAKKNPDVVDKLLDVYVPDWRRRVGN